MTDINKRIFLLQQISDTVPLSTLRLLNDCNCLGKLIRLEIAIKDLNRLVKWGEKMYLNYEISNKSFRLLIDQGMENWSSYLTYCDDKDPEAKRFVYFHNSKITCGLAKKADEEHDDLLLGKLFGYPECCIKEYVAWKSKKQNFDPIVNLIALNKNNSKFPKYIFPNPFTRYIGLGLYDHFPCSFSCTKTKNISVVSYTSFRNNFPTIANNLICYESSLVLFIATSGICFWNKFSTRSNKIEVNSNCIKGQGKLHKDLKDVKLLNTNYYNDKFTEGNYIFFGQFYSKY